MSSSLKYYSTPTSSLASNAFFLAYAAIYECKYLFYGDFLRSVKLYGYADLLHVHIKSSISMLNNLFQKIFLITIAILYFNKLLSSIRICVWLRWLHTCTDQTMNIICWTIYSRRFSSLPLLFFILIKLLSSIRICVRLRRLHNMYRSNDEHICWTIIPEDFPHYHCYSLF